MQVLKVEINGRETEIDLDILSIPYSDDLDDLNQAISKQPSLYAWYAYLTEVAKTQAEDLKNELELLKAKTELRIRKVGIYGVKKITDSAVSAGVTSDKDYVEKLNEYTAKKGQYLKLKAITDGFIQRKDMLATLSANVRKSHDNDF